MITDSLDIATETYINEEDFYGKQGKMVDTCIIIFSDQIYQKILTTYACKKISEISGCNGSTDIMSLVYKGKEIAFYLTELGSTMCNVIKLSKNKNLEFYLATGKALFLMKYFFSYE